MTSARWPREAWIPLLAGLYWLWAAPSHGALGFLASVPPGCLMVGSGVMMLLTPGDLRISQFAAGGGVIGGLVSLPLLLLADTGQALILAVAAAASYLAGGYHTLRLEPHPAEVPLPGRGLRVCAEVGIDEALLSSWTVFLPIARGAETERIASEVRDARALFASEGWLESPARYLEPPPPLEAPSIASRSLRGLDYEHLSFDSDYEPHTAEPGRERWLSYAPNRRAHAWLLRHRDGPRPTLVCVHGYQMGVPRIDLGAFQAERLHRELGLDVVLPVLPLHGLRKIGRLSGDGYLSGEILDTLHAEAQAIWDLRRVLSWVRGRGAPHIGLYGISLGGYNAALLAGLEDALECVICGIPAVDFTHLMFRHGPPLQVRRVELEGLAAADLQELLRPVSPLTGPCRVAPDGRALYAASADRIVPAAQVAELWRHWGRPEIAWYDGGHCSFSLHREVHALVARVLRDRLLGDRGA